MRWIITGGAGFIGKNLVIELLKQYQSVVVVDKLSWYESGYDGFEIFSYLPGQFSYKQRDLTQMKDLDFSCWFSEGGGDIVVHLAAMSGIKECSEVPLASFDANLRTTFALLDGAADYNAQCFVFASSGAVVSDSPIETPSEITVPKTANIYGSMKACAEHLCRGFTKERGLNTAALRFSNVYGPYSRHKKSVAHAFIQSGLKKEPLVIHGGGEQTRDFVYVRDVARGIIEAGKFFRKGAQIFHLSSGVQTAILFGQEGKESLYDLVCKALGEGELPIDVMGQDPGVPSSVLSSTLSRYQLCIGDPTPLAYGIQTTVDWYRNSCSSKDCCGSVVA